MYYITQALITIALLWLISTLCLEARRRAFSPMRMPHQTWAYTVITAYGDGAGLEQVIAALTKTLGETLPAARIVIDDCGLDGGGVAIAQLLAQDYDCVIFKTNDTQRR